MKYLLEDAIIKLCFRFITLGILVFFLNLWINYECKVFGEITGIETKREQFTACYVKVDGKWISYLTYQLRNIGGNDV